MLNKIMMSGKLLTEPVVTTKNDLRYCKFSIAVDQPKQKGVDAVETDTFTCLTFDDNANAVSFLYSKGGTITFVGSLRNATNNTAVLIVEELHFKNRFAVKVDTNSGQLSDSAGSMLSDERKRSVMAFGYGSRYVSINMKRGSQIDFWEPFHIMEQSLTNMDYSLLFVDI